MRQSHNLLLGLLPWLSAASPLAEHATTTTTTTTRIREVNSVSNANHIFNSIHDSMRQFGSSLNHNGMGVFIATVPEGTEFYHGTADPYRVNGTQWLAFEPEHAMMFARSRGPPPDRGGPGRRPGGGPPGEGPPEGYGPPDHGPGEHGSPREGAPGQDFPRKDGPRKDGPSHGRMGKEGSRHGPPRESPEHHPNDKTHPKHDGPTNDKHGCEKEAGSKELKKKHQSKDGESKRKDHDSKKGDRKGDLKPAPGSMWGRWMGGRKHDDLPPRKKHHAGPKEERPDIPGMHRGPPGPPPRGIKGHENPRPDQLAHHRGPPPPPHGIKEHEKPRPDQIPHHRGPPPPPHGINDHEIPRPDQIAHHQGPPPPPPPPPPHPAHRKIAGAIGRLLGIDHQEPLSTAQPAEFNPTPKNESSEQPKPGYLHTYRAKHALRLIYLDGQSAAKSAKGTLDVQDMVIRNTSSAGQGRGMFGEMERADEMCQLARTEYDGRIDGILRMEGGFEIILCSFAKDLDVVRITQAQSGGGMGPGGGDGEDQFSYYEAVAARYQGIGGERVALDFGNFVSLFACPDAVYFDTTGRPRVRNDSMALDAVRRDIKDMILGGDDEIVNSVNWQTVTDQIVDRYASRIEYMVSGDLKTAKTLKAEIERAIRPFIDYSARNAGLEAERCATQFWPVAAAADQQLGVAGLAVRETYQTLCSTLASAANLDDEDDEDNYETAFCMVRELKDYLAWTTWKRCRGCAVHEICLLPIWPMGSDEDFVQPRCASAETWNERRGDYWGGFGGPRHPKSEHQ